MLLTSLLVRTTCFVPWLIPTPIKHFLTCSSLQTILACQCEFNEKDKVDFLNFESKAMRSSLAGQWSLKVDCY